MDPKPHARSYTKEEREALLAAQRREDDARRLRLEFEGLKLLKDLTDTCTEAGGLDAIEVIQEKLRQMFPKQYAVHRLAMVNRFAECVNGLVGVLAETEAREEDDEGN